MARYNHFSKQEFKPIPFQKLEIGEKFRKDFFKGNRRRKDIICVKTGQLTYIEQRSKTEHAYKFVNNDVIVRCFSERVG